MKTLDIINKWVAQNSSVLDLGCGKGEILLDLISSKNINAVGVEIDSSNTVSYTHLTLPTNREV